MDAGVWKPTLNYPTTTLLHFDGADGSSVFTDASMRGVTFSVGGNAKLTTAQSVFGGASLFVADSGTGGYIYCDNDATAFTLPGDFSIECWINIANTSSQRVVWDTRPTTSGAGITVEISTGEQWRVYVAGTQRFLSAAMSVNAWHHLALCRAAGTIRAFLDGVSFGTPYADATIFSDNKLTIGSYIDQRGLLSNSFRGYLDEFRFTKGLARYTANFTPPSAAFDAFE